ncbi:MAG: MFS transporter [Anaerolineae bacterium UTCFX2]|jgi:NNP family nitrate/nitrite transporter-like MFS transporter|nr:MAG: MFS transporter [Anaerolineae bacterium UTCFX2]
MEYSGNPDRGLFGATLGFFVGFASVALFGATASKFNEVMQLSPVMIGVLVAIPSLSGSLLRIPFGAWVDVVGGRKPFLVLLWLSVAGMAGLLGVTHFLYPEKLNAAMLPLVLTLGFLCGCGIATFSVGISQVSYWFSQKRQGTALGIYAGLGNLAPGIFSLILPFAITGLGLSGAYLAWLIFLLIGTVLYHIFGLNAPYFQFRAQGASPEKAHALAREAGQEIFPKGNSLQSLAMAGRNPKTWMLVLIYFTTFGGYIALTAWFPTYWKSYYMTTPVMAGMLTAMFSLLASLIRVGGGSISDRLGGVRTLEFALIGLLIGALVLVFASSYALSITGALIMGIGMGISNAAVFKLMPQYVPNAVGGASGWIGGLGAFGGFLVPPVLGIMVRNLGSPGYATGFVLFVILGAVSLALTYVLSRRSEAHA